MEGTLRGSIADVLEGQISGSLELLAGEPVLEELSVSSNGVYEPRTGVDGFDKVIVDVPTDEPVLDDITINENGHYTPPSGVDGYDDITVNVPTTQPVLDDITINENGHYTPPSGVDGYDDITVYVPYVSQGTTINDNGTYTPPSGVDGFDQVIVNVPNTVQGLNVTENGTYTAPVGSGVVGYSPVTVNVPTPSPSLQSLTVSHNGYFLPSSGYVGFSEVNVDVATPLETLSATENGTYTPSSGYEGFSKVTVDVPLPNNAYLLESQKNDVVTIQHGAEFDMPKLIASIEPQQSGSGEPSPENVRPISGWNKCKVSVVGKNKVNPDTLEIGYYNNNGEKINDGHYRTSALISAKSNTVYTTSLFVKHTKEYVGGLVTTCWDVNENIINQYTSSSFTTPPNTAYIRVRNFQSDTSYIMNDNFIYQLEEGLTATEYEPYNGNTYTINFVDGSNPLIVYGGTLDVLSGVLTITDGFIPSYNGETLPSTWISDRDVYAEGTTPTTGAEVCYKLATPQTYQLTPTQVKSLLGVNNIFADTGEVDVQIWTKEV